MSNEVDGMVGSLCPFFVFREDEREIVEELTLFSTDEAVPVSLPVSESIWLWSTWTLLEDVPSFPRDTSTFMATFY